MNIKISLVWVLMGLLVVSCLVLGGVAVVYQNRLDAITIRSNSHNQTLVRIIKRQDQIAKFVQEHGHSELSKDQGGEEKGLTDIDQ